MPSWRTVLIGGLSVTVLGTVLNAAALARVIVVVGFVFVVVARLRRTRSLTEGPWRMALIAGVLAFSHAVVRAIHGAVSGEDYPFPSVAEPLAFGAYAFIMAAALGLVRARTVERRREDVTDSAIVAMSIGLVLYNVVFVDYLTSAAEPLAERVLIGAYIAAIIGLAGTVARVAFGPGERNIAYYLLATGTGATIMNDVLLRGFITGWDWALDVAMFVAPIGFVFVAAAISHPDVVLLSVRPRYAARRVGRRRLVLLAGALLLGPTLILADLLDVVRADMLGTTCLSAVLGLLVLMRMIDLVRAREAAVDRERRLRDAATKLATAADMDQVTEAALEGCFDVTVGPTGCRASLYRETADGLGLVRSTHQEVAPTIASAALEILGFADEVLALEQVEPLDTSGTSDVFVALVPMRGSAGRRLVCVLTQRTVFTQDQVETLEGFAAQVSVSAHTVELREQLHQRRSNRRFRALVENSSDVVIVVDDDGRATFVSPTVRRLLGREEIEVVGRQLIDLVARQDHTSVRRLLATPTKSAARHASVEVRMLHGSGDMRWFELEARDLSDDPEVAGVVVTASDVSDRKRAEAQLLRSEARFRLLVQNTSDVVAIIDDNSLFTYVSPSVETMLGFGIADVLGRNVFELLSVTEAERLRAMDLDRVDGSTIEVRIQGGDGRVRVVEVAITDMRDQPEVDGTVLNIRDVTERKSLEDDLRHQALHDDLTGLANRALFADRVDQAVHAAGRSDEMVGVLFVDLDDFKLINDSLGHVVGDQVLVSIAQRIQECLRLSDVAARLGGDEFAVLLTGVYAESEIIEVADRVREAVGQPITVGDHDFRITASLGVVVETGGDRSGEDLLRSADLAMYKAKQEGKDRHQLFESQMEESAVQELELKSALLRAVENHEFVLHYQPIVEMGSARIKGVEALIRWEDPHRGMVSPAAFIPAAEETGLIREIGMWVAQQASQDLARWRESGHDLYCSINVSGRQMVEQDFAQRFIETIAASGADGEAIVVELTESVLAVPGTKDMFDAFHSNGYRVALDDFGTGYSALQYLQTFDIDIIKIDRSFVTALGETKDTSVVQAVLDVAASIEATTLAEGIEDTTEVKLLKALGVELGQGYYYSRPVPEAQLLELLAAEFAAPA